MIFKRDAKGRILPKYNIPKKWLYEQYIVKEKNSTEIGKVLEIPIGTILYWLKRYDIPIRPRGSLLGEKNQNWKGGRVIRSHGYIYVRTSVNGKQRYVAEHRLVMEKVLGRPLTKKEVVHHINKDRKDNRPENLILFSSNSEHTRMYLPTLAKLLSAIKHLKELKDTKVNEILKEHDAL